MSRHIRRDRAAHPIGQHLARHGWPDAWAVETSALREIDGETRLTMTLAFRDSAGRAHMAKAYEATMENNDDNGQDASYDAMEDFLASLLAGPAVS